MTCYECEHSTHCPTHDEGWDASMEYQDVLSYKVATNESGGQKVEEQVSSEAAKLTVEQVMQPKVTVGFERSVSVRPYETAKASVFIQAEVPIGYSAKELESGLRDAMFQAKAQVFEQLGIEFEINEHGVIMELLTKSFGPVDVVKDEPTALAGPKTTALGDGLVCGNDPTHKMWDNRAKKAAGEYKPSAPDGKCSQCDYKAWPPKKA